MAVMIPSTMKARAIPATATNAFIGVLSVHSELSDPEKHSSVGIISAHTIAPAAMTTGIA
jgi:hypothetical protein